jgi:hypothetical protein
MIDAQFRFNQCNSFREEYISVFSPLESLWLTYNMGFFMNFELLPVLTDYAN